MAIILNTSQQQLVGGQYPQSLYSRVVTVVMSVPAGPGAVYVYTPPVGQNVWLLGVRIWFDPKTVNQAKSTLFRILSGENIPKNAAEILGWDRIFPCSGLSGKDEPMAACDGVLFYEWTMRRHWTGLGRMFGLWAERGPLGMDEIMCSFEISEG
jgi:hypothetical protein